MTLVDTNVLAYLLIEGDRTPAAQALYARDPADGRRVWETPAAGGVDSIAYSGGRIWILTTSATRPTDELLALDPGTGRAVARIGLPTSGGVALVAVGSDLWVTDNNGDLHIVHP